MHEKMHHYACTAWRSSSPPSMATGLDQPPRWATFLAHLGVFWYPSVESNIAGRLPCLTKAGLPPIHTMSKLPCPPKGIQPPMCNSSELTNILEHHTDLKWKPFDPTAELQRPRGWVAVHLLIQLFGATHASKKDLYSSNSLSIIRSLDSCK